MLRDGARAGSRSSRRHADVAWCLSLWCRLSMLGARAEEPGPSDVTAGQRELLSRLRAVVEAKDAENAVLRRELDASGS